MTFAEHVQTHLMHHGPCTVQEVLDAMRAAGRTTAKTANGTLNALRYSPLAYELPDGRWQSQLRALIGATFTTRPRSRVQDDVLWTHRDLEPLDALLRTSVPWQGGGTVRCGGDPGMRTLLGPAGWLPDVQPGDLLALRWDGSHLHADRLVDAPDPARSAYVRRLLATHAAHALSHSRYGTATTTSVATAVLSALREDPDLFAQPVAPLSELLPLPDADAVDATHWEHHGRGQRLTLRLPERVVRELERRSEILGDTVPDYASMLLGAAVDRARPLEYPSYSYRSYDDRSYDEPPHEENEDSVVTPFRARS